MCPAQLDPNQSRVETDKHPQSQFPTYFVRLLMQVKRVGHQSCQTSEEFRCLFPNDPGPTDHELGKSHKDNNHARFAKSFGSVCLGRGNSETPSGVAPLCVQLGAQLSCSRRFGPRYGVKVPTALVCWNGPRDCTRHQIGGPRRTGDLYCINASCPRISCRETQLLTGSFSGHRPACCHPRLRR